MRPLALIPTTASAAVSASSASARAPASASSSALSDAVLTATCPPAITPSTRSVLNVGPHSLASSTPIRPAVPAPA